MKSILSDDSAKLIHCFDCSRFRLPLASRRKIMFSGVVAIIDLTTAKEVSGVILILRVLKPSPIFL